MTKEGIVHKNVGTCSQAVKFDIIDDKVRNVQFIGGCPGNTVGVAKLIDGMDVDEAISRMKGIQCGARGTSCPDQLAQGLEEAKAGIL